MCTPMLTVMFPLVDVSASMAGTVGGALGGALLHCGDERLQGLATWPAGGPQHQHTPTLATPTLWQYPGQYQLPVGFINSRGTQE